MGKGFADLGLRRRLHVQMTAQERRLAPSDLWLGHGGSDSQIPHM